MPGCKGAKYVPAREGAVPSTPAKKQSSYPAFLIKIAADQPTVSYSVNRREIPMCVVL